MPVRPIVIGRDEEDAKRFGELGTITLGKHIVGTGEDAHLTNTIVMDVARPHVMLVLGKRGQGKSYTLATIAEGVTELPKDIRSNLSVVIIDTMGIFWSMKNPNEKQVELLAAWGLQPKAFDVTVYVPHGHKDFFHKEGIPYDGTYALNPSDLTPEDWALSFELSLIDPTGILLDRVVRKLKESGSYGIDDIIEAVDADRRAEPKVKEALQNRLLSAKEWGLFSSRGTPIEELLQPGKVSIIDTSLFSQLGEGWSVRSLLVGLVARRIYEARIAARRREETELITGTVAKKKIPLTWLMIDEAHQFLPADGRTAATEALLSLVKQGRQPGISCVFATQRPNKLHEDAISQADLVLTHRLTVKADIDALRSIMQTYVLFDITKYLNELPREKGVALVLDDNSERLFTLKVKPRQSWHAGDTPIALRVKEGLV
ncbi:MAG: ATP-binding protein [Candidatus Aenigmatarchaeota archaeon]|nr:MAG: ATP-binding protein [Candidatus Aenigmarchaeota archaeon]